MPISMVRSAHASASGAASVSVSFGATPSVNNSVIAAGVDMNTNGTSSVNDTMDDNQTPSNTYARDQGNTGNWPYSTFSTVIATASGTFTVTYHCSESAAGQIQICEVSGLLTSGIYDKSGHTTFGSGTPTVSLGANTAQASEFIFAYAQGQTNSTAIGPPTVGIDLTEFNIAGAVTLDASYQILTSISTPTETWTNDSGGFGYSARASAYKGAASVTTPPPARRVLQAVNRGATF